MNTINQHHFIILLNYILREIKDLHESVILLEEKYSKLDLDDPEIDKEAKRQLNMCSYATVILGNIVVDEINLYNLFIDYLPHEKQLFEWLKKSYELECLIIKRYEEEQKNVIADT